MRHHWRSRHLNRRHGPPPFVRRMGIAFAALFVLTWLAASAVVGLTRTTQRPAAFIVVLVVVVAIVAGFILSMRRVGHVFREQDRLRRQLMADVAHELRTPLSILQGRIEGLIDGVYPRDDARLAQLLDETRHLSRLVEDLRTIANAEAGALELRKELVDPGAIIADAAASFDRPIAVDIAPDIPPVALDPVRMREVLLNLLSNAVRHTPEEGRIEVRASMSSGRLVIDVSDSGRGIAAEDLPHVFDRFHKARDSHGSGLGLSIAKNLVRAHGGEIHAASELGKGTRVTITI